MTGWRRDEQIGSSLFSTGTEAAKEEAARKEMARAEEEIEESIAWSLMGLESEIEIGLQEWEKKKRESWLEKRLGNVNSMILLGSFIPFSQLSGSCERGL